MLQGYWAGKPRERKPYSAITLFLPPEWEADSFPSMVKAPDISTQQLLTVLIQTQTKLQSCDTVNPEEGWAFKTQRM